MCIQLQGVDSSFLIGFSPVRLFECIYFYTSKFTQTGQFGAETKSRLKAIWEQEENNDPLVAPSSKYYFYPPFQSRRDIMN